MNFPNINTLNKNINTTYRLSYQMPNSHILIYLSLLLYLSYKLQCRMTTAELASWSDELLRLNVDRQRSLGWMQSEMKLKQFKLDIVSKQKISWWYAYIQMLNSWWTLSQIMRNHNSRSCVCMLVFAYTLQSWASVESQSAYRARAGVK